MQILISDSTMVGDFHWWWFIASISVFRPIDIYAIAQDIKAGFGELESRLNQKFVNINEKFGCGTVGELSNISKN